MAGNEDTNFRSVPSDIAKGMCSDLRDILYGVCVYFRPASGSSASNPMQENEINWRNENGADRDNNAESSDRFQMCKTALAATDRASLFARPGVL